MPHELANHPILVAALGYFAPKGAAALTVSLNLKSGGLVPLDQIDATSYRPAERVASWTRRNWREAQNAQASTGFRTIFLGLGLVQWQGRKDYPRHAPRLLQPLDYDPATEVFFVAGPPDENRDLTAVLANDGKILSIDPSFCRVFIASDPARAKRRLIDPVENPAVAAAPAFRRLLALDANPPPQLALPDRHPALTAQRRTPLDLDQQGAYAAALSGADVVVQGPPGTGKSEVIAEIARAGLEAGRRVLIASTIDSALDVSRRRLKATGHVERYHDALAFETPDTFCTRPLNESPFDLLVIDEAARMTVYEALLLGSRAHQIVLCGDHRQLPVPDGVPNVYDRARSIGFAEAVLHKHYRSETNDLILFSNSVAYGGQLRVTPGPRIAEGSGVHLTTISNARVKGSPQGLLNFSEAKFIAEQLSELAAQKLNRSSCVVAATAGQVVAINQALAERGLKHAALSGKPEEPFFVRQMNQVQGEERDHVFVSMTFSPRNGTLEGALGKLETETKALERLNVAFSRARANLDIVVSFTSQHLAHRPNAPIVHQVLDQLLATTDASMDLKKHLVPARAVLQGAENIRCPGDRLDNLGILHGWARPGSTHYDIGILVRFRATPAAIWDEAVAQLKVAGWTNLVVLDEKTFTADFLSVQEAIERAAG